METQYYYFEFTNTLAVFVRGKEDSGILKVVRNSITHSFAWSYEGLSDLWTEKRMKTLGMIQIRTREEAIRKVLEYASFK